MISDQFVEETEKNYKLKSTEFWGLVKWQNNITTLKIGSWKGNSKGKT